MHERNRDGWRGVEDYVNLGDSFCHFANIERINAEGCKHACWLQLAHRLLEREGAALLGGAFTEMGFLGMLEPFN